MRVGVIKSKHTSTSFPNAANKLLRSFVIDFAGLESWHCSQVLRSLDPRDGGKEKGNTLLVQTIKERAPHSPDGRSLHVRRAAGRAEKCPDLISGKSKSTIFLFDFVPCKPPCPSIIPKSQTMTASVPALLSRILGP